MGFLISIVIPSGRKTVPLPLEFVWRSPDGSSVPTERTGGEYMAWTRPALEFNIRETDEGLEKIGYDRAAVFRVEIMAEALQ